VPAVAGSSLIRGAILLPALTPSLPFLQGGPHGTTWVLVLSFDHSRDQLFAGLPHFMIL